MFDKFLKLFSGQVSSAVTDGADEGLQEADIAARVQAAVEEGVQNALDGLHKLLSKPAKKQAEPSNGKLHAPATRLTAKTAR